MLLVTHVFVLDNNGDTKTFTFMLKALFRVFKRVSACLFRNVYMFTSVYSRSVV